MKKSKARSLAKDAGEKVYESENQCPRCGSFLRYTSNRDCIACKDAYNEAHPRTAAMQPPPPRDWPPGFYFEDVDKATLDRERAKLGPLPPAPFTRTMFGVGTY